MWIVLRDREGREFNDRRAKHPKGQCAELEGDEEKARLVQLRIEFVLEVEVRFVRILSHQVIRNGEVQTV